MILMILFFCVPSTGKANADFSVSAEHAVLMDSKSGRVLYEKEAYESSLIASTTKIMTAIIAIESGMLKDKVKVSSQAVHTEGSSIYLTEDEKMPLEDLVYGLMLRSGNDSAVAIAEHVGGSLDGFVYLMNEKANWLGMNHSHFENPHGLDGERHYSSAYDLGLLMAYAMKNKTFREVTGSEMFRSDHREYAWMNKNKLLTKYYEPTNGGKTGFTKKAGRTLVSSAERDGMELIAVTLNAPDDWNDHQRMYEWGFDNFETVELQKKGIWKANGQNYYIPRDVELPLSLSEQENLEAVFYRYPETVNTPLAGVTEYNIGDGSLIKTTVLKQPPNGTLLKEWKGFFGRLAGGFSW
ncbi:D-alanyl-D-alanine carboxypeptidase [Halobacillus fulvus]|nr:D-alanyl-D-alanine carboxypeptidase [Halobacillus fulvus]